MANLESRIIRSLNPDSSANDCALIEHGGQAYLYTTDSLAEGTHFRLDWSHPEDIAFKLLHVNLSDLLAAGGEPEFCLLNLGLPEYTDESFIQRFASYFRGLLQEYGCSLVGGDTFRSNGYLFSLTLSGPALYPRFRTASTNDGLYLSGTVGLSRWGYEILQEEGRSESLSDFIVSRHSVESGNESLSDFAVSRPSPGRGNENDDRAHGSANLDETGLSNLVRENAIWKHLRPMANIEAARQLNAMQSQSFPVSGSMDLSDGLFADCQRFSESSGLNLEIDLNQVPLPSSIQSRGPQYAASSGEELELLVASSAELPAGFARIGTFGTESKSPRAVFKLDGKVVGSEPGFEHFKEI